MFENKWKILRLFTSNYAMTTLGLVFLLIQFSNSGFSQNSWYWLNLGIFAICYSTKAALSVWVALFFFFFQRWSESLLRMIHSSFLNYRTKSTNIHHWKKIKNHIPKEIFKNKSFQFLCKIKPKLPQWTGAPFPATFRD